jgi:hypothetical protein
MFNATRGNQMDQKHRRENLKQAAKRAQELASLIRAIASNKDGYRPQDRLDVLNAQFEALLLHSRMRKGASKYMFNDTTKEMHMKNRRYFVTNDAFRVGFACVTTAKGIRKSESMPIADAERTCDRMNADGVLIPHPPCSHCGRKDCEKLGDEACVVARERMFEELNQRLAKWAEIKKT